MLIYWELVYLDTAIELVLLYFFFFCIHMVHGLGIYEVLANFVTRRHVI